MPGRYFRPRSTWDNNNERPIMLMHLKHPGCIRGYMTHSTNRKNAVPLRNKPEYGAMPANASDIQTDGPGNVNNAKIHEWLRAVPEARNDNKHCMT